MIKAFEHMIDNDLYTYSADPWCREPIAEHYESLRDYNGQVDYKDEIFVVTHRSGSNGMGGMDQGSPPSVAITRIKRPAEEKVKVELIECEAGWGQRVDEVLEFNSKQAAREYCDEFNEKNDELKTPEWYMYARIV
jgi:hypothetical protein